LVSTIDRPARLSWIARALEFAELTKPRVVSLVLVCAAVSGFVAASGAPDILALVNTLVGTALVAASGSAFNQIIERRIDGRMQRTMGRPLPSRRVTAHEATALGTMLLAVGTTYLWLTTNPFTLLLTALTWGLYVCVYTPLKQRTWLNTPIGAVPGALPVLIGWCGAGEPIRSSAWVLFLLVFIWQFPHFMAIAWIYRDEYREAGLRMITGTDLSGRQTGIIAAVGAGLLVPLAWWMPESAPWLIGVSLLLAAGQLGFALVFLRERTDLSARGLLRASLVYLPLQLGLIVLFQSGII
jgi:protoheme IX farnesyltransferase